ncbi:hypothetical protein Tco_0567298 [Tanacetum coccineum]
MVEIILISLTNPRNIGWRHARVSIVKEAPTWALIVKQGTHPSLIRVPVTIKSLVLTNLYSILRVKHSSLTVVSFVEVHIIVMSAKQGTYPSMIRVLVTIRTIVMTNLHSILRISNNRSTIVRSVEVPIIALIVKPGTSLENNCILEEMLRTQMSNSLVVLNEHEGSDDYTEVTYDKEQCLSDHYTAHVTPPAYTPSIPFLATMEPTDALLMGDEVIRTIPARETDEFLKSSVDDFVPIPRESEMTSDSVLECDMPATTPLPPTDNGEVDFDINSPLGEYVVDFLMENEDVDGFPRHLVKYLFNHLLKNPSLTKGMSDEPLGDDSKPVSYDVTFSNPLFDFNDYFTLCNDNPLFDEEFKDISSLVLPELTPVIDESTLLVTLPSPYLVVLEDENIDLLLRDDLDALLTGDREIDFNPCRDIEELERLLADDIVPVPRVFDDPLGITIQRVTFNILNNCLMKIHLSISQALLHTESSSLVPPLLDPKQLILREVERFDPFFSLTQSSEETRVIEAPSFSFHHMPSLCPAVYSPKEVMYCYYHSHVTSGDGFDHGPKMK